MGLTTWTQDRIAQLKRLWADGLSASQCAAELGGISRNSALAKIHRLGVAARAKRAQSPKTTSVVRKRQRNHTQTIRRIIEPAAPLPVQDIADQDIPYEQRKSLMKLDNFSCRFPYGAPRDETFFFCGKPEADLAANRPYCLRCTKIAHNRTEWTGRLSKVSVLHARVAGHG